MGYKHTSTLVMPTKQPSEERVGNIPLSHDGLDENVRKGGTATETKHVSYADAAKGNG